MARARKRRNPMPRGSALFLSNPRRRNGKRSKRSGAFGRVIAKLNGRKRRNSGKRRSNKGRRRFGRRRNSIALKLNGRGKKRRSGSKRRRTNGKRRSGGRRRNGIAARLNGKRRRSGGKRRRSNRRRNPVALRTNRGGKKRRGSKRRNRNPRRRFNGRRRRNGVALRSNRGRRTRRNSGAVAGGTKLPIFSQAAALVRKIPVVGKIVAPFIVPAGILGLAGVGTLLVVRYALPLIPMGLGSYIAPVGYTVSGIAFGIALSKLPIPFIGKGAKSAIAKAAPALGIAIDLYRAVTGTTSLGDGGLWQLGGVGDGGADYGDADSNAVTSMYGDASSVDAAAAGADLSPEEGEAAISGPRAWLRRFPGIRRVSRIAGGYSPHAGQHGHRWGWLIKMVGFQKFRQIAALPPAQRHQYLQGLRKFAQDSVPGQIAEQQNLAGYADASYAGVVYAGSNY